jgi:hypothetical protein
VRPRECRLEGLHVCRRLKTRLAVRMQWPQEKADFGTEHSFPSLFPTEVVLPRPYGASQAVRQAEKPHFLPVCGGANPNQAQCLQTDHNKSTYDIRGCGVRKMRWDGVVTANPGEEQTRGNEGVS